MDHKNDKWSDCIMMTWYETWSMTQNSTKWNTIIFEKCVILFCEFKNKLDQEIRNPKCRESSYDKLKYTYANTMYMCIVFTYQIIRHEEDSPMIRYTSEHFYDHDDQKLR